MWTVDESSYTAKSRPKVWKTCRRGQNAQKYCACGRVVKVWVTALVRSHCPKCQRRGKPTLKRSSVVTTETRLFYWRGTSEYFFMGEMKIETWPWWHRRKSVKISRGLIFLTPMSEGFRSHTTDGEIWGPIPPSPIDVCQCVMCSRWFSCTTMTKSIGSYSSRLTHIYVYTKETKPSAKHRNFGSTLIFPLSCRFFPISRVSVGYTSDA